MALVDSKYTTIVGEERRGEENIGEERRRDERNKKRTVERRI